MADFNSGLLARVAPDENAVWTCSETAQTISPANAMGGRVSDGDGNHYPKTFGTGTGSQNLTPFNMNNAATIAIKVRVQARSNNYSIMALDASPYQGGGMKIMAAGSGGLIDVQFAAGGSYTRSVRLNGDYFVGDIIQLVVSWDSNGTLPGTGEGIRIWEYSGPTRPTNDPDHTLDTVDLSYNNITRFAAYATTRGDFFEWALWNYRLSDADSAAMIQALPESINQRNFGGGPSGPIEDSPTTPPTRSQGVVWNYDASQHWSARGGGTLSYGTPANFPTGMTINSAGLIECDGSTPEGSYTGCTYVATETGGTAAGSTTSSPFTISISSAGVTITIPPSKDAQVPPQLVTGRTASNVYFIDAEIGNIAWSITNHAQEANGGWLFSNTTGELFSGRDYFVAMIERSATGPRYKHIGEYPAV